MDSSDSAVRLALLAMGIEDADEMSKEELLAYASSLNISLEDINMLNNNPNSSTSRLDVLDNSNVVDDYLNTGYLAENDDNMQLSNLEYHTTTPIAAVTDIYTPMISTNESNEDDSSHMLLENDAFVSNFCTITGCDTANAQQYLEAFGFDFETAIAVYMDSIDQSNSSNNNTTTTTTTTRYSSSVISSNNDIQPPAPGETTLRSSNILEQSSSCRINIQGSTIPIPTNRNTTFNTNSSNTNSSRTSSSHQRFFESFLNNEDSDRLPPSPFMGALREMMESNDNISANHIRQFMEFGTQHFGSDDDDDINNYMRQERSSSGSSKVQDEYDESGVRRPDPVQRQQLLGGHGHPMFMRRGGGSSGGSHGDDSDDIAAILGRAEDPSIDWMFPPPRHLSHQGTLAQARHIARSEGRWLLVNIQSNEQFHSHLLNRDTWVDETVVSFLRTTFLFWQRGHTTGDAIAYMRMHKLSPEEDLPHIAIIDPRTGAKLISWMGFIASDELVLKLVEFLDLHSLDPVSDQPLSTTTFHNNEDTKQSITTNTIITATTNINTNIITNNNNNNNVALKDRLPINQSANIQIPIKKILNYGPLPNEIPDNSNDENLLRISIKLINGKSIIKKYLKTTKVCALFALVLELFKDDPLIKEEGHEFDLVNRYPMMHLSEHLDATLEEMNLNGTQLLMKII